MDDVFKSKKINSPFGIFFQIPVFIIAAFGLYKLIEKLFYSFTEYNLLGKPTFVGFENYLNVFKNEVVQKCLGNTVVMVFGVTVLLVLTAVLPAIFTARLKLPFGLGVMGAFSFLSICAMLSNFFNILFSGDSYGILNSILINASVINEPIIFIPSYAKLLVIIAMWLYCLAPVFSITYIAARKKHSFLGAAIAVCAIPVFMYSGGGIIIGFAGYPSANYSADWIYTIFNDYLTIRFEAGFAYAILIIGLIMLIGWCVLVCSVALGFWALFKKVNSDSLAFKVIGYITFALSLQLFITVSIFIIIYLLKAFMPPDELFTIPNLIPKRPTLQNFSDLGKLTSVSWVPFSWYLINSLLVVPLMIMPVCFSVLLPSGVGFGLFKAFKQQKLLLLCFIPFLFISSYVTFSQLGMINSYSVYMFNFLSSFELLIAVFLVYLAVRLVSYNRKPHILDILLGSFFVLSSFYAIGVIRGIWYSSGGAIYNEKRKIWKDISAYISSGGIARCGIAAANDILMLLVTLAVVIIPLILLLTLYLLYRRNTKNLIKEEYKDLPF
ncbi:MAG: hypothetical protein E7480_07340 [Ruminococcaceae bacterium]|nr:hypothetical protein [Oscillospiraceae bacterium]